MSWAESALKKFDEQQRKDLIEKEALVAKQEIKRVQGPLLWRRIRELIEANCAEFNRSADQRRLVVEESASDRLQVRFGVRVLRVVSHSADNTLGWGCEGRYGNFTLEVDNAGHASFSDKYGPWSPESIAEQALNALLFS
jgi:hypothetical protein